jgi:hypothetical protein
MRWMTWRWSLIGEVRLGGGRRLPVAFGLFVVEFIGMHSEALVWDRRIGLSIGGHTAAFGDRGDG